MQLLQPAMNEPARGRARPRPGPAARRPGFPEAPLGGPGGHAAPGTLTALCKVPRGAGPGSASRAGQGGGRSRSAAAPAEPPARPGVGGAARPGPASGVAGAGRVVPCQGAPPTAPGTWRVAGSQVTRRASPGPRALPRRGAATLTSRSEGPAPFAALAGTIELPARPRRPRRSGRGGQSSSRPQAARAAQTGRPPAGHRAAPPPLRRALPLRAGWGEEGSSLHPLPRSGRARDQSSRTSSQRRWRLGAPAQPRAARAGRPPGTAGFGYKRPPPAPQLFLAPLFLGVCFTGRAPVMGTLMGKVGSHQTRANAPPTPSPPQAGSPLVLHGWSG